MHDEPVAQREITIRAVVLAIVLAIVMGAANVYLGLKAGMTVSASIPAAVIAMLTLRALFKDGTILEANQVQTAASAGESLAAGIIFTMPALVLIGVWQEFDMLMTTLIAFSGGLLGILFMIPMRKVFVVRESSELRFPEGVACASVLQAGQADTGNRRDALSVVWGTTLGALFKALVSFFGVIKGNLENAWLLGDRILFVGGDISPALMAVGIIVRLNVAILVFIGGALAWLVGIPLLGGGAAFAHEPAEGAWSLWSTQIRYVGVGAMVVGGLDSIFKVRHGLLQAVREISGSKRPDAIANSLSRNSQDRNIPSSAIITFSLLAITIVGFVYHRLTGSLPITIATTLIMVVMAFFFTAVASYIVGLVGNSNSPVSGMTITAVLFTGLLLTLFQFTGEQGIIAILGVAAVVCCAACTSGDVCNDLKTGHLVGASPFRQQIMQILGVAVASLVMAPVLQLLHNNTPGGIGGRELSAPQASLFASLARGFFGDGQLPWHHVAIGAGVGVVILMIDNLLAAKNSSFRAHLMPIAVGMYLPFGLAIPILLGGLLSHWFTKDVAEKDVGTKSHRGILFASGIIAGESLLGVAIAGLAAMNVARFNFNIDEQVLTTITIFAVIGALVCFYRGCRPEKKS